MFGIILKNLAASDGCKNFIQSNILVVHLNLSMLCDSKRQCFCLPLNPYEDHTHVPAHSIFGFQSIIVYVPPYD
jgi:hypothetical protein